MSETCPKCGTVNPAGRVTCISCGAELDVALFAEMFGPPRRIKGRYAVQSIARQGSKHSIYRAVDTGEGNRPCLVHQVTLTMADLDMREMVEQRFLQEAAAWQKRRYPNIVDILDADVQHHRLYLVTGLIRGVSLQSIIGDRQQSVAEQVLLHWAAQVCDALEYLHTQDPPVVLGCLSPATIYVDQTGHVQLTEVGLIRYNRSGLLQPARGLPGYAAPEQRKGQVTSQSDIYTVGIILYQLMTRLDPRQRPLPPLRKYGTGFSETVIEAVVRAYRSDPGKRYASAAEMRQALAGTSAQPVAELPPFELAEGYTCTTVPELIQLSTLHWDSGLQALLSGRTAGWLARSVQALREAGKDPAAEEVEKAARQTADAQERMVRESNRPGMTGAAREIAQNAAFAAWLQEMGALGLQPSLQVSPSRFDFGVVGATIRATTSLQIRNRGQGYLSGRVESALNWLTIPEPVFGCRAGETVQVRIVARGRALPAGESSARQAIHVISSGGDAWIEARATSSPPLLSVAPRTLQYGPITRGSIRVAHLSVSNQGGGRLTGQVISRAPWLRVRHPDFSCSAGASAQIAVELLSEQLPRGAVRIRRALAVDSDSGQAQIDVSWSWARPSLELDTTGIDMGSVEHGAQVERRVILSNSGTADLVGEAVSQVDWLSIQPAEFRCPPGGSQALLVTCDTHLLPGGSTVEPEAIVIRANAGTQTLSASVEVLAPQLVVEPAYLDLGTFSDGDQVEESFTVGNRGSLPLEGRLRVTVPWLVVEPVEIRCEPGHFMPVTVMANPEAIEAGGEWSAADGIQIESGTEVQDIGVRLALLRPQLGIERHSLDFGLIGRMDIVSLPLEIRNLDTGVLEWDVEVQGTWIEVVPSSGTCGAGETAAVQVNAYALAVDGDSDQAWLIVRSNGGRVDLPASVALSSPLLAVEPLVLELHSENYAPVSQPIQITNRGVGTLRGTIQVQVPWLACEPQAFECPTGVSTQIQASARLEDLREGTYAAADALLVESNGGHEAVDVRLILTLSPELHVSPQILHFNDRSDGVVELENQGYGTLRVQVVPSAEWLTVNRRDWTIKPGKKVRVRVNLVDAPANGTGSIEVRTPDQIVRVDVEQADSSTQHQAS